MKNCVQLLKFVDDYSIHVLPPTCGYNLDFLNQVRDLKLTQFERIGLIYYSVKFKKFFL